MNAMTKILATTVPQLHIFHNDVDWVIAPDLHTARVLWLRHNFDYEQIDKITDPDFRDDLDTQIRFENNEQLQFEQLPDESMLAFQDDDGKYGGGLIEKTCRQWADTEPMGYFCSTEY